MNSINLNWVKRGIKDFFIVLAMGIVLISVCFLMIKGLITLGLPPEYSSTVISLCLLFSGSMMYSYFEMKREHLEKEKQKMILEIKSKRSKSKSNKNVL